MFMSFTNGKKVARCEKRAYYATQQQQWEYSLQFNPIFEMTFMHRWDSMTFASGTCADAHQFVNYSIT